ncbi:MAG: DUF6358 family protein [Bacteroidota bacterium]
MVKKIALNVFYNLAIIVSIIGIIWCFNNAKYPLIALFLTTGVLFGYLKVQLMREVKNTLKK